MISMTVLRSWELCIEEIPPNGLPKVKITLGKTAQYRKPAQHCCVHVLFLYAGFRGSAMTIGFLSLRF
jgi:hypothetical protein